MASQPVCALVIGMAGSGKTTFTKRFFTEALARRYGGTHDTISVSPDDAEAQGNKDVFEKVPFMVNLDPAVLDVPYSADVDITELIDYKKVMQEYQLGPNGAIMTCLNLFAAQFNQVIDGIEAHFAGQNGNVHGETPSDVSLANQMDQYVILDTPGQIEVFTWSASGSIITETLAAVFPTVVLYIVDTNTCKNPASFISNMLYACSIFYKTKLPFILVFNKIDETPHEFAEAWLRDYESFQDALGNEENIQERTSGGEGLFHIGYIRSLSLVLEEFYRLLSVVGVSSLTGEGFDDLFVALGNAMTEYVQDYLPWIESTIAEKKKNNISTDGITPLNTLFQNFNLTKNS